MSMLGQEHEILNGDFYHIEDRRGQPHWKTRVVSATSPFSGDTSSCAQHGAKFSRSTCLDNAQIGRGVQVTPT